MAVRRTKTVCVCVYVCSRFGMVAVSVFAWVRAEVLLPVAVMCACRCGSVVSICGRVASSDGHVWMEERECLCQKVNIISECSRAGGAATECGVCACSRRVNFAVAACWDCLGCIGSEALLSAVVMCRCGGALSKNESSRAGSATTERPTAVILQFVGAEMFCQCSAPSRGEKMLDGQLVRRLSLFVNKMDPCSNFYYGMYGF